MEGELNLKSFARECNMNIWCAVGVVELQYLVSVKTAHILPPAPPSTAAPSFNASALVLVFSRSSWSTGRAPPHTAITKL